MKFLTTEEAKSWCQARGLKVTADRYLHYEPENPHCFTLGLPSPSPPPEWPDFTQLSCVESIFY